VLSRPSRVRWTSARLAQLEPSCGHAATGTRRDLDHFKQVNDTFGHASGDRVLAEFGLVLLTCMRENDYAARYGGEEFASSCPPPTRRAPARFWSGCGNSGPSQTANPATSLPRQRAISRQADAEGTATPTLRWISMGEVHAKTSTSSWRHDPRSDLIRCSCCNRGRAASV
jgi:GGDEF domain-containing protein